jgi:ABC-type glycerol-3-phosphate transport system substrate-binding protein
MKKMLVLAAALAFSVVAVGCGGSSTTPSKVPTHATTK